MPNERRVACIRVSPKLLAQALHIPDGAQVYGAEWDFKNGRLVLYVADESLSPVNEGMPVPDAHIQITEHFTNPTSPLPSRIESKLVPI